MDKYVMRDGELFRDDGDGSGIVLYGTGVILRELNALQNQLNVMSDHSAALAVSNYDLIAENNALQQRVEELEANIKEAVKEIELEWLNGVAGTDGNRDDVYQSGAGKALDILRKHRVVEDK